MDSSNDTNVTPVMESPGIAFILAVIAGTLNGFTYYEAETFSTVQSGNIILLGQTIATQNWPHFQAILLTVFAFGLGSMMTAFLEHVNAARHRIWTFSILLVEAAVLIVLATGMLTDIIGIAYVCVLISFVAGMQGNAFHKIKGMMYGNVAVTMVVQLAFNYLMRFFSGDKTALKTCALFFLVLLGFAIGGMGGTLVTEQIHERALFIPALFLLALAIYLTYIKKETDDVIDSE